MNFVKRQGKELLNHYGEAFLLKGVGLGGWLLPEGYMWRFPEEGDRPRKIEEFIETNLGKDYGAEFWKKYRSEYINEKDIQLIKKEGYNSVRIPFNSRYIFDGTNIIEDEFYYIDQVVKWCVEYELYVVLDMHGAPGGQTGTNIDDSKDNQPNLFIHSHFQDEAVRLWLLIAKRYKDNEWIAGYDLLNEPLPEWFSEYNDQVVPLYKRMIKAIRSVDKNHMIILEGVHWSTDLSVFTELLDDNVLLQFHKYWNNPDQESIQKFLDLRESLDAPLYMGEGGENNNAWYTGAFHMFESLDISWNFWTYKKMDNDNSLISVDKPEDWSVLIEYLQGKRALDKEHMKRIFDNYLENISFDNSHYNNEVTHSLLRKAPVNIPGIFYDYLGVNNSYYVDSGKARGIGFRVGDGVSMSMIYPDQKEVKFDHGDGQKWSDKNRTAVVLSEGEWVKYSFSTSEAKAYLISLKLATDKKSDVAIETSRERKVMRELELLDYKVLEDIICCNEVESIKVHVLKGCVQLESLSIGEIVK